MSQNTNTVRPDNPLHPVVNLKYNDSLTKEFESMAALIQHAKQAETELQALITSRENDPSRDPRRWILSTFWLISNILAHDIITSISTFINDSQAVKETALYTKLEMDFITMNIILHQFLELTRQKVAFVRILDVKSDDFHVNQQYRLFEYLMSTSDSITHSAQHFMEQFHCALSSNGSSTLTSHLQRTSVVSSLHSSLMKSFKQMLIVHPLQKANAFLHSDRGKEVVKWAFEAMKLFTPPLIAETSENLFRKLVDKCPLPVQVPVKLKESEIPLQECGTLRPLRSKPCLEKDSSEAMRPTI